MSITSDEICTENHNTFNVLQLPRTPTQSCRLYDNLEEYGRAGQATKDNIIWRVRFACWLTKTTDAHLKCLVLLAFPRQHWLRERISVLRYTCIACLV
jgi:hypothetical protein